MSSALWVSKTGLAAQDKAMSAVANNLANVNTNGFKSDRVVFEDLFYAIELQPGAQADEVNTVPSGIQLGSGVRVAGTQKVFTEGSIQTTGQPMDLAIVGAGFFQVEAPNGDIYYTENGQLQLNAEGMIVNSQGLPLTPAIEVPAGSSRFTVGSDGIVTAVLAGDSLAFVMNLDSNQTVPATAPFDPADVNTYNSTYTTKVFDSQGKEHTLTQYFVKTGDNTWDTYYYQGNTAVGGPQALTFGTNGTLTAPVGPVNVGFALPGVDPMAIAIDYSNSSQYGSDFVVTTNRASGYAAGEQTGLSVEKDGMVYANYSNGQRMLQGQVALATFANAGGLKNISGTAWVETADSGAALIGVPGVGPFGALVAGSLENSNVDLTQQLVGLMEGQRNYQANTKVLTTNKELTQVLFGAI